MPCQLHLGKVSFSYGLEQLVLPHVHLLPGGPGGAGLCPPGGPAPTAPRAGTSGGGAGVGVLTPTGGSVVGGACVAVRGGGGGVGVV